MRIIPVIDLLNGIVVRGVAGQRETYEPVKSILTPSSEPLVVAGAIRDSFGLNELYVADLDAILNQQINHDILTQLADDDFELMVDAGIRSVDEVQGVEQLGSVSAIFGLETCPDSDLLSRGCDRLGPERMIFSLDLQAGRPLTSSFFWAGMSSEQIVRTAVDAGIRRMIVLDLKQVGVGAGVSTIELCRRMRAEYPDIELITGGGVRGVDDLIAMEAAGVEGVLVASALHNGTLVADDLGRLVSGDTT